MKVTEVAPFYYPIMGGVEKVVQEYSERLVKRGHDVTVLTTDKNEVGKNEEVINGVNVIRSLRIKSPFLRPLSPSFELNRRLKENKPDVIHVHANKYFSTDCASYYAKSKKIPLVYSPHAGTFGSSLFGKFHNQTIGKKALSADVVLCVSEYEKKLIESSGADVKRLEVLPNGVDISKYEKKGINLTIHNELLEKYGLGADSKLVLYIGRIATHKGLDVLVNAASEVVKNVPEAVFFIVGPDGGERSDLELKVSQKNLTEKFVFTGKIDEGGKIIILHSASVFCLPSRSEAFGISTVEAMVAGVPVVVSDLPALTEIVKDGETGLVFPVEDSLALSSSIIKMLSDSSLANSVASNAFKKARENYDWDIIVDRLEKVYLDVIQNR